MKAEPHYWANRAGTIVASQLPIMTALGMRNNLVSRAYRFMNLRNIFLPGALVLTGVSFDKVPQLLKLRLLMPINSLPAKLSA
jgi:hypothetical protein